MLLLLQYRLARGSSTVGNFSHCSLRDVFRYVKEQQPFLVSRGPQNVWRWSDVLYKWFDGSSKALVKIYARDLSTRSITRIRDSGAWFGKDNGYGDVNVFWWKVAATISDTVVRSALADMGSSSGSHKGKGLVERCCAFCQVFDWALALPLGLVESIIWVIVYLRYLICFMLGGLYQKEAVGFSLLSMEHYAEFGAVGNCGLPMTIVILSSWTLDPLLFEDECCLFTANDPFEGHSCNP
ncbi:hypothetical protein V6N12_037599 [Hibiscus sabdariffa]|uniref:Uncharacterized protein n=1 Tax=Hibiscus sabdariffa TaxID=183260 RepID=A0ABR2C146_9ROSI